MLRRYSEFICAVAHITLRGDQLEFLNRWVLKFCGGRAHYVQEGGLVAEKKTHTYTRCAQIRGEHNQNTPLWISVPCGSTHFLIHHDGEPGSSILLPLRHISKRSLIFC